jgi:fumarate hydratase class I
MKEAIKDISFYLRTEHLQQLRDIIDDPEASPNDRFVALDLLKNVNISAGGVLPMCQDTGTALVLAKRGANVMTEGPDEEPITEGIYQAYHDLNLRYSQLAPLTMWEEKNTGSNLPAQIEIMAETSPEKANEYSFLIIAKGGGSANKSLLYQQTKAVLNPEKMKTFLDEKLRLIGTSACPPYHLAIVIGGTTAEFALKVAKLASTKYLDTLPTHGNEFGQAFRDNEMESKVLAQTCEFGIGAQFGGKYFCHDVRVIRLPRHNASLPIAIAVSCAADRQALAKITADGVFLEELEQDPAKFLPETKPDDLEDFYVSLDLNRPIPDILAELSKHPVKTRVHLTGTLVVARDMAHARVQEMLDRGEPMPDFFKNHPIYYAGPAKTPAGLPSGSFGPTTAGRMDSYVAPFQANGGSLITLAKGNRSAEVTRACEKHGGFYLGTVGGPGARIAHDCIKHIEVIAFPDLGMEAVWKIEVEDFPAFIVVDDKGNDFFEDRLRPIATNISVGVPA